MSVRNISTVPQPVTIRVSAPVGAVLATPDLGGPALTVTWQDNTAISSVQTLKPPFAGNVLGPAGSATDSWNSSVAFKFYSAINIAGTNTAFSLGSVHNISIIFSFNGGRPF